MSANRVWDIIAKTHICMLVTNSLDALRARPLDARLDGTLLPSCVPNSTDVKAIVRSIGDGLRSLRYDRG